MKSRRIYNHENAKRDQKFDNLIKNTPKLTALELLEESDKLWRETVKREKMARERKRKLRMQQETMETANKETSGVDCDQS